MKTSEVVVALVQNDATERPVYVTLFLRDKDGNVLSKKRFPVEAVFSYQDENTSIHIDQANCLDT